MKNSLIVFLSIAIFVGCTSVSKIEAPSREIASELKTISIIDTTTVKILNRFGTNNSSLLVDGRVVTMSEYANSSHPIACFVIAYRPTRDGDVFKFAKSSYANASNFADTTVDFKNKTGMIAFSIVCHNKNFKEVEDEEIRQHFNNIISFE